VHCPGFGPSRQGDAGYDVKGHPTSAARDWTLDPHTLQRCLSPLGRAVLSCLTLLGFECDLWGYGLLATTCMGDRKPRLVLDLPRCLKFLDLQQTSESLDAVLSARDATIVDASHDQLLTLALELAGPRIESAGSVRHRLQPIIANCLETWRMELHHNHPLDLAKRSYHPVFSAIDQNLVPDLPATLDEIQYLHSTRELLSRLLDYADCGKAIWKERIAIMGDLESALRKLTQGQLPVEEAGQVLNSAESSFRLAGTEVTS